MRATYTVSVMFISERRFRDITASRPPRCRVMTKWKHAIRSIALLRRASLRCTASTWRTTGIAGFGNYGRLRKSGTRFTCMTSGNVIKILSAALDFLTQKIFHIVDFLAEQIQLSRETLDFGFRPAVHVEIEFTSQAVLHILSVLAHHDDGRLDGCEHGEKQVEQDERIRVPGGAAQQDIDGAVNDEDHAEDDDEGPGAAPPRHRIGDPFAEGGLRFYHLVGIAAGAQANQFLRGMKLAAQDRQHIHSRVGLALQEHGDVIAVHLNADRLF